MSETIGYKVAVHSRNCQRRPKKWYIKAVKEGGVVLGVCTACGKAIERYMGSDYGRRKNDKG